MSDDAKQALQKAGTAKPSEKDIQFERERRIESGKAAKSAIEAKKKAHELREAAAGANDPDERQELLNKAIDKEIEAETFGKTAKYLRSGTFQGMVAGMGLGVVPGATLGALTGTLVGGTVSLITGGLGAAGGAITGAIHGPFFNLAEATGEGIRKITGDIPGWKATTKQKKQLEKMIGQVKDEDMPDDEALENMAEFGSQENPMESVSSYLPSALGGKKGDTTSRTTPSKQRSDESATTSTNGATKASASPWKATESKLTSADSTAGMPTPHSSTRSRIQESTATPVKVQSQRTQPNTLPEKGTQPAKRASPVSVTKHKKPRKLELRSPEQRSGKIENSSTGLKRRPPRKLEKRS